MQDPLLSLGKCAGWEPHRLGETDKEPMSFRTSLCALSVPQTMSVVWYSERTDRCYASAGQRSLRKLQGMEG